MSEKYKYSPDMYEIVLSQELPMTIREMLVLSPKDMSDMEMHGWIASTHPEWDTRIRALARKVIGEYIIGANRLATVPKLTFPRIHKIIYDREYETTFEFWEQPTTELMKAMCAKNILSDEDMNSRSLSTLSAFGKYLQNVELVWSIALTSYLGTGMLDEYVAPPGVDSEIAAARERLFEYETAANIELYTSKMALDDFCVVQQRLAEDISLDIPMSALVSGVMIDDIIA